MNDTSYKSLQKARQTFFCETCIFLQILTSVRRLNGFLREQSFTERRRSQLENWKRVASFRAHGVDRPADTMDHGTPRAAMSSCSGWSARLRAGSSDPFRSRTHTAECQRSQNTKNILKRSIHTTATPHHLPDEGWQHSQSSHINDYVTGSCNAMCLLNHCLAGVEYEALS